MLTEEQMQILKENCVHNVKAAADQGAYDGVRCWQAMTIFQVHDALDAELDAALELLAELNAALEILLAELDAALELLAELDEDERAQHPLLRDLRGARAL